MEQTLCLTRGRNIHTANKIWLSGQPAVNQQDISGTKCNSS